MTTGPAVQAMPRERAAPGYDQLNEQRYRQQADEELQQKHDKRSNLVLGRGKSLILSSPGGLQFALALDDEGFITVTDYSTGDVGELTIRFDNVEGLAQEFIDVRAEFAAADGTISSAYIAADAVVAADAASANASLSTTLTAAYQAADSTVASNAAALVTSEASTRASADSALASDITTLEARVDTTEADIGTIESTASAIDARLVAVEADYATATSVTSLTATVSTKARTFSQASAPTATATGDLWIDTDDNNRLYRWSGTAWVEVTDPRIASSASTLTTVTADITSLESAVADLDATKAEASALTSLTATVTTVQSDLDTVESTRARTFAQTSAPTATTTGDLWIDTDDNNKLYRWSGSAWVAVDDARIATNAAAITTESAARASGDSANATSITNLTASVNKTTKQDFVDNFNNDGHFWTTAFGGAPESVADPSSFSYVDVANIGRVAQFSAFARYLTPKAAIKPYVGMKLRLEAKVRATVDPSSGAITAQITEINGLSSTWAHGATSRTISAVTGYSHQDTALTVADGWVTIARFFTCSGISTYDAGWRPRLDFTHTGSGGTVQVAYFRIEDVTEMAVQDAVLSASITTESSARASGDSANATSITSLTAAVSSIRQQALPTRPAVTTDFSAVASGSTASIADLSSGTTVAVANEGDVRQFTAGANIRHKGYLPVVSGRTYRVRARVRTTVDGTDNRVQVGFRYLDSTYTSVGFDAGSVDNTFTVADGWLTLEYTRTGAQILTAAATSAYVTSRTAIGVNAGGTSSGATTQVAWVELEDITDFTTNAAAITTNAAAITTESSARASGDSANATLITNLTAEVVSLRTQVLPDRPAIASDFTGSLGSGTPSSIAALATGTIVNVANEGDVRQFTDNTALAQRGWLPVVSGNTYRCQFRARVTVDGTGNQLFAQFVLFNAAGTVLASFGSTTIDASFVAADGWVNGEITGTGAAMLAAQATAAFVRARVYGGRNSGGTHSGATWQAAYSRLEDITELETLEASVTVNASAIADIEGRLTASYSIQVDGGGNGALVSLEDGTTLGSVVKLAADKIELRADALDLGTDTTFEATHDTFYTTAGSYRFRYGGPFGTSSDLLQWYGPTSVSLNSETKTNGVFALATDGRVYVGSAAIGSPITITRTNGFVKTRIGSGTITSDSVSFSSTGGSGTGYTYAHELFQAYTTGPTPTISSSSGSPITASAASAVPGDEVRGFVQTTVTDSQGNKATLLSPVALFCET